MDLQFLGGAGEVGRSAILVNDSLLLDYGMKTATPPQFPVGTVEPEAVVASHGHLDHVGSIPSLLSGSRRPPIHWTPPTRELALTLARDTLKLHGGTYDCPFTEVDVRRVTQVSETHGYREPFEVAGHEVTFFNAGHSPTVPSARRSRTPAGGNCSVATCGSKTGAGRRESAFHWRSG